MYGLFFGHVVDFHRKQSANTSDIQCYCCGKKIHKTNECRIKDKLTAKTATKKVI